MATRADKRADSRVRNMTEGKPLEQILRFAIPLLIGNLFQQVYNMVDTMVAGRCLGDTAIAAIGATSVLYSLLMNITWGLNSGYCIVLSREFGAGERQRFKDAAAAMLLLNLTITAALTVISLLGVRPAMRLLKTPGDIFEPAYLYIAIILGGMAATSAYNMAAGFLRAIGNSRTPLYFLIFSSLFNLAADVFFIRPLAKIK